MPKKETKKIPLYRKKGFIWPVSILLGLVIALLLGFRFSPWPGAILIRTVFNTVGGNTLHAMREKLPDYPVTILRDQRYQENDEDARLDVYIPEKKSDAALPVVVWTHGGGWVSGDKKDAEPYFKRLSDLGFVVVSVNYSLAPDKVYPTAIHQLNDAHKYIKSHAASYGGDPSQIILAGDSAGAQMTSQMAALVTNPAYAAEMKITPSLTPADLQAVLLYCGIYKMEELANPAPTLPRLVSWGDDIAVWALTGSRDKSSPSIREMSAYYHVTADFPKTFITGGNGDLLTEGQSKPFAEKLKGLGVEVDELFYAEDYTPSLPHEYQFTFNDDGEKAFARMVEFLRGL